MPSAEILSFDIVRWRTKLTVPPRVKLPVKVQVDPAERLIFPPVITPVWLDELKYWVQVLLAIRPDELTAILQRVTLPLLLTA